MKKNESGDRFDLIVIGAGSAGVSAIEAALDAGAGNLALIEGDDRLGGECPNRGCVPSKALLRSVEVLRLAKRAKEFGLRIPRAGFDLRAVMKRKKVIVDALSGKGRVEKWLADSGVTLIRGWAEFTGPNEIKVGARRLSAGAFVVATGSETSVPPVPGLDGADYLVSDDLVSLEKLPKSMLILGGGPIGVEWAQILGPLGVRTTIVEYAPHLLPREDEEIAAYVHESFRRQKIGFLTSAKAVAAGRKRGQAFLTVETPGGVRTLAADALLVATGKRPQVSGLALDKAGVALDKRGAPIVDEYLRSSNASILFAGDAAGQMLFTHVAHYQGEIAGANAVKGQAIKSDLTVIPRGTYCDPEVGSVGLTEKAARDKGGDIGIGRAPYSALGKGLVSGEMEGLVKIVVDKASGRILGGHVVGHSASELVHELALAMYAGISYKKIGEMVHAYPTFSEGVGAAASSVE